MDHRLRALEVLYADHSAEVVGAAERPVETGLFIFEHLPGDLGPVVDPKGDLCDVGARRVSVEEGRETLRHRSLPLDHDYRVGDHVEEDKLLVLHYRYRARGP